MTLKQFNKELKKVKSRSDFDALVNRLFNGRSCSSPCSEYIICGGRTCIEYLKHYVIEKEKSVKNTKKFTFKIFKPDLSSWLIGVSWGHNYLDIIFLCFTWELRWGSE